MGGLLCPVGGCGVPSSGEASPCGLTPVARALCGALFLDLFLDVGFVGYV